LNSRLGKSTCILFILKTGAAGDQGVELLKPGRV